MASKNYYQALLTSIACVRAMSMCTYVRTYLRRTTHLDLLSYVSYPAQGG